MCISWTYNMHDVLYMFYLNSLVRRCEIMINENVKKRDYNYDQMKENYLKSPINTLINTNSVQ